MQMDRSEDSCEGRAVREVEGAWAATIAVDDPSCGPRATRSHTPRVKFTHLAGQSSKLTIASSWKRRPRGYIQCGRMDVIGDDAFRKWPRFRSRRKLRETRISLGENASFGPSKVIDHACNIHLFNYL